MATLMEYKRYSTFAAAIALSILNRVAPTMNLFSVGLSIRTGFGIFCMVMLLPVIFAGIRGYLYRTQMDIEELLMLFQLN